MTEEVTVAKQEAAGQQGRNVRAEPPAPRLSKTEATVYTAANLYTLMAWLYDRPQT